MSIDINGGNDFLSLHFYSNIHSFRRWCILHSQNCLFLQHFFLLLFLHLFSLFLLLIFLYLLLFILISSYPPSTLCRKKFYRMKIMFLSSGFQPLRSILILFFFVAETSFTALLLTLFAAYCVTL